MDLAKKNKDLIIAEILKKAELRSVSPDQIAPLLEPMLKGSVVELLSHQHNPKHLLKSSAVNHIIKKVRAELRTRYGMFKLNKGRKIEALLGRLKEVLKKNALDAPESLDVHRLLLAAHRSTAERLDSYDSLYENIFATTGKPASILDLGCGLNPVSYPFMDLKEVTYHAREWAQGDVDLLKRYFAIIGLKGTVERQDLLADHEFPKVDICFLWKILDVIENQKRGVAFDLLDSINSKWIVISFATKTLGGSSMRTKRVWFTKLLERLNWASQSFQTDNEIFYLVSLKKE